MSHFQSNFGAVSLNYTLSDQPVYGKVLHLPTNSSPGLNLICVSGNWTIRVQALHQIEEKLFYVEEYYQPRFEVGVNLSLVLFTRPIRPLPLLLLHFEDSDFDRGSDVDIAVCTSLVQCFCCAVDTFLIWHFSTPRLQSDKRIFNRKFEGSSKVSISILPGFWLMFLWPPF